MRPTARQHVHQGQLVEHVGLDELDLVTNADEVVETTRDRLPHHSEDVVAFREQEFGEERPVLSGDPDDERSPAVHRVGHLSADAIRRGRGPLYHPRG